MVFYNETKISNQNVNLINNMWMLNYLTCKCHHVTCSLWILVTCIYNYLCVPWIGLIWHRWCCTCSICIFSFSQRVGLTRDPSWTHLMSSLSYMKNSPAWPYLTSYFPDKLGMCPSDHEVFKERKTPGKSNQKGGLGCSNLALCLFRVRGKIIFVMYCFNSW